MKYRHSKIPIRILVMSSFCILLAMAILHLGGEIVPTPYYDQQLTAAKRMQRCIDSLKTLPLSSNSHQKLDPNQTNLIGVEYSPITTTLGDLIAKRTSTNPDFAALFVHWFNQLQLKPGDIIAIGCSGSFPALILSAICAAESKHLQPIIITSMAASSYGANRPDFTYLDIENYLLNKNLIHHRTQAAAFGGVNDTATDLSSEGRHLLLKAIHRNNIQLIKQSNFEGNMQTRTQIYDMNGLPKVFINIGGAQINVGDYASEKRLLPGLNYIHIDIQQKPQSIIEYFSNRGIPIIHILRIEQIALRFNLPIDPVPLPEPGRNSIYFTITFSPIVLFISICSFLFGVFLLFCNEKRSHILFKK